jgi:hypothetical protein
MVRMTPAALSVLLLLSSQSAEDLRSIVGRTVVEGQVMTELRALAGIGPRMTGTKAYDRAVSWAESRFRTHGLDVRLEPVPIAASWRRGPARVRVVAPYEMELVASSVGWSPPTPGAVRGPLRVIDGTAFDRGQAANAIVLIDVKKLFSGGFPKGTRRMEKLLPLLRDARVRAVLLPFNDALKAHRHFGADPIAPLPMIDIPRDVGVSLMALAKRGPVEVEARNDSAAGKPVVVKNVIAELPGRGDGWILVGAHLDTWDVTPGAQDNAAGVAEVIEAARILSMHANAWGPPRRKIRFALWAAEEIGLVGSTAYAGAHANELSGCAAVINTDSGAGEVRGWHVNGRSDVAQALAPFAQRIAGIGAGEISSELVANSDTVRFWLRGVPALDLWVAEDGYFDVHHRPNDDVEHVRPHRVAIGAAAVAAMAWMLAEAPEPIAPHLSAAEVDALIDRLEMREAFAP